MDQNQIRAMEKALQNPLILQKIFRKLSASDLLDCRLVSSLNWFDLATDILCDKKGLKINFDFSTTLASGKFNRAFENPTENPWSLKSLVKCIKESNFFPCFRFRFSEGDFDNEDLKEFFSVHGESIVELELDLIARANVNNTIENFGEILWKKLPNLEKLTIWKVAVGYSNKTIRLFSMQVRPLAQVPKLKHLNFEKSLGDRRMRFIQDIQDAAPNLLNVQKLLFTAPKKHLDSNLWNGDATFEGLLFLADKSRTGFYERVLRTKAKFNNIRIEFEKIRKRPELLSKFTWILTEILKMSQSSLREINGIVEILTLPEFQWNLVQFPAVKSIHLQTPLYFLREEEDQSRENGFSGSIFSLDSKSSRNITLSFPSLAQINLDSLDFIENCADSFPTVKLLRSRALFSNADDFQKLAKVFPMLEDLNLNNINNFRECADSLWKNFSKLKKLQIGIYLENSNQEDVSMENAFFGIQTTSSILELQELKTLHLTITPTPKVSGNGHRYGKWTRWNFLKKSTALLVNQKMKQLESFHLIVDARQTDCTDWTKIHKQLKGLNPFINVQVYVNQMLKAT